MSQRRFKLCFSAWAGCISLACGVPGMASATPDQPFALPPVQVSAAEVLVKEVRFSGNSILTTEELQKMAQAYVGHRVTLAELEELRISITRKYIALGYLNSGAVLVVADGQDAFPDGLIPIRLIEGRITHVNIKGQGRLQAQYLEQRLVLAPEVFNMPVLQQRFQLLLTDPLFEKINSRLIPGDVPGTAILDIDVQRAPAYGMTVFLNNYRAPSIGSQVLGSAGWVRNLTGRGDMLDASISHSEGADPVHLGWTMPLNSRGTSLKLSADQGSSSVIGESLAAIDIKSRSSGGEAGLTQTLQSSPQRKIELGLSYAQRESRSSLLGEAFSFTPGEPDGHSRIRVWRFSQEWTERAETQALAVRSVFAFGRNNIDQSASGAGAAGVPDASYRIWTGQLQYVNNLAQDGRQIVVRAFVQQTPDRLLPLERFSLGGAATVRGYRENALVRDRAFLLNAEFHYPLSFAAFEGQKIKLISFADMAIANNQDEATQKLASMGVGMNWQWNKWSADLFLARKLKSLPNAGSGNLQDHGVHFQMTYHVF
ncbi:ShlB/FhaC/HecB family hemolysin secretion/activation protein [Undibacterium sp. CY18W]|uniref:ShlB/FhaC/HecB family hemolysin secretion/activation protein n=2 Tax=Undibacterium hunanense TaxID=2762292 RepID=A0ABR6ZSB8_9BURK|nr:ShlB/FhaC/HecB family hemolysin secretion/activation protein [Undibacterium hunanense]